MLFMRSCATKSNLKPCENHFKMLNKMLVVWIIYGQTLEMPWLFGNSFWNVKISNGATFAFIDFTLVVMTDEWNFRIILMEIFCRKF